MSPTSFPPTLQIWGAPHIQRQLKMRSKSWSLRVHICHDTNKGIHCFFQSPFSWILQIDLPYFLGETHFHVREYICTPKCTECTPFGYTVLRVQPLSWSFLNLRGHTFFLSPLIPRGWCVVLEFFCHPRHFLSSVSFPFWNPISL